MTLDLLNQLLDDHEVVIMFRCHEDAESFTHITVSGVMAGAGDIAPGSRTVIRTTLADAIRALSEKAKDRRCTCCREVKPADLQNFGPDPRCTGGLSIYCRICERRRAAVNRAKRHGDDSE